MNITATTSLSTPIQQRNGQTNIQKSYSQKSQTVNNQVNFTGLSKLLRPIVLESKIKMTGDDIYFLEHAASVLDVKKDKLIDMARGKTVRRMAFLSRMVERFNGDNWGKKLADREDGQVVIDLFSRVKKPVDTHMQFLDQMQLPMTDVKRCFDAVEDNPKELKKIIDFNRGLSNRKDKADITRQIVSSPNKMEYINNPDKYVPYFNAMEDTKGAVVALDKEMAAQSLDLVTSRAKYDVQNLLKGLPASENFTKEMLLENYSPERAALMTDMLLKIKPTAESLDAGDAKGLMKIYNSTNEANIDFRKEFLGSHYYNFGKRKDMRENEINEIAALFELTEKDPSAKKFISKVCEDNNDVPIFAYDYLKLFEEYGSEYLNSNSARVKKCINSSHYNSYEDVIEAMDKEAKSPMNMVIDSIKGMFGIKIKGTPVNEMVKIDTMDKPSIAPVVVPNVFKKPYTKPEIKVIDIQKESMLPTAAMPNVAPAGAKNPYTKPEIKVIDIQKESMLPAAAMPELVSAEPVAEKKVKPLYRYFKSHVPQQPNAKKLIVINDVNNIIEKKLGTRVFSEQSRIYADKATKMRASMLPEIFESIKETRAAARANGTFSRSKTVSNEDAIDLYTRINGKNKKLVNYMLKVRAEDGTRRYTVKDIINVLNDANREILRGKNLSTKENRFTPKDERAIYDRMFEEKLALYGKLPRASKKSKKA